MSYVLGDGTGRGLHVLIVCVAHYDDPFLNKGTFLSGAARSAERFVDYWRSAPLPAEMPVASIDIVISYPQNPGASAGAYERNDNAATWQNVSDAFHRLVDGRDGSDLGVIHWIGHGASFGQVGGHLSGLYTQDMAMMSDGPIQHGIDIKGALAAMSRLALMPVLATIDACQGDYLGPARLQPFSSPFKVGAYGTPKRTYALFSAPDEKPAFCASNDTEIDDGLFGGALFSEAVRLSLNGFGAELRTSRSPAVYADSLSAATFHHHKRLCRNLDLAWHRHSLWGEQFDFERPLVVPDDPRGVVEFLPTAEYASTVVCNVEHVSSGPVGPARPFPGHWEAHLAHDNDQMDYEAHLHCTDSSRNGSTKKFAVTIPLTRKVLNVP